MNYKQEVRAEAAWLRADILDREKLDTTHWGEDTRQMHETYLKVMRQRLVEVLRVLSEMDPKNQTVVDERDYSDMDRG